MAEIKKLLYVLDDGMRKFTYEWVEGMRRTIRQSEEDIDLFIVRADIYAGFSPRHNRGESNIYRLPDYRDFDGILLDISNAFQAKANDSTLKGIRYAVEAARASGRPVISMANHFDGCHYVGIDNYAAMTSVIRHLHEAMGLTDFWFAMGPAGNSENQTRTRALRDYCAQHGLPCGDGRFHAESFAVESGVHAFERLRRDQSLPQAVVCANDEIALGVCRAAKAAGYSIPGDLRVTGFDNLEMSAYLMPSMTTVDQKLFEAGKMIDLNAPSQGIELPGEGYSDGMELVYSWVDGQKPDYTRKKVGSTLPAGLFDGARGNHLFVPLHFKEYTVGYPAICNCLEVMRLRSVSTIVNILTQGLRTYFNRRDMRYVNRMLSGLSMKDNLTGLYNRLGYHNLGHKLFNEISRRGGRIGILFIDMDQLKFINDTMGHASGDQAICCVANAVRHNLPQGSVPVRFGGDEFLVLMPVEDREATATAIDGIVAALPSEAEQSGMAYVPQISVGYVVTDPASNHTLDEYVESADNLMYQQKREKHG